MTLDRILDELMAREGGFSDDPSDRGGATKYGITAATLGNWRGWMRPATAAEVQALTRVEAKAIYIARYIEQPGFTTANVRDEALRVALIDAGVHCGPATAVKWLQRGLGVKADGVLGRQTIDALSKSDAVLARTGLVKARCLHYGQLVRDDATQRRFIVGWLSRALSFLPSEVTG